MSLNELLERAVYDFNIKDVVELSMRSRIHANKILDVLYELAEYSDDAEFFLNDLMKRRAELSKDLGEQDYKYISRFF